MRAQMCVQVASGADGDAREWDAHSICAKGVSIALAAGEVVLQAVGVWSMAKRKGARHDVESYRVIHPYFWTDRGCKPPGEMQSHKTRTEDCIKAWPGGVLQARHQSSMPCSIPVADPCLKGQWLHHNI